MSDLADVKLVPRDLSTGDSFVPGAMTVEFGTDGNPTLLTNQDALDQDVLKALFTGPQPDGYGTIARSVLGEKNVAVIQSTIVYTTIQSLQALIQAQRKIRKDFPTQYRGRRCLETVDFIRLSEITPTKLNIRLDLRTKEAETRTLDTNLTTAKG